MLDRRPCLIAIFLTGIAAAFARPACAQSADFVLLEGRVHTLDTNESIAQAVAIREGKIVYVGDDAGAMAMVGDKTEVYRAGGRTVIPGLNETHVHPTGAARGEVTQPFMQLHSIDEIKQWVRRQVAITPKDVWIRLPRVDVTRIKEGRMPAAADLDEVAEDHPVVFVWQYANRQIQILNRAALRAAGITKDTVAPGAGKIVKDSRGEPTGVIEDAAELTSRWLPRPNVSHEQYLASLEKLLRLYAHCGITSITDRSTSAEGWKAFQDLKSAGRLPIRTTLTIRVNCDGTVAGAERFIRDLPFQFAEGDDWVKIGPLKIAVDGGVLYGTAYLREPYGPQSFDLYGLSDPRYRGLLQMEAQQVENVIRTGHRLGWQMCSHVTGDAGVDMVLDAVEAVNRDNPINDRRYTLIHAYFAHADTAARAAKLGVCVDTQPAWLYKDGDALADALGDRRLDEFIGLKTWQQAGLKIAINSDHMQGFDPDRSLNPYNPFLTLYTAITRATQSGAVYGADQSVSRTDALRMLTSDAAWLHFDETKKGTLEIGKLGDLAVLTGDYFSCSEDEIRGLRSVLTVVGGKVVHRAP